jgi:hypothetical protein
MEEEKKEMREKEEKDQKKEERHMGDGIFISRKSLWLAAGGALGALAAIGISKASKKIKPTVVGAVKEGYAFKEWAAGKIETAKEDIEDIVAEAKHAYHKDIEATQESVKKEKEILQKVEEAVEKKVSRKKKKEGE